MIETLASTGWTTLSGSIRDKGKNKVSSTLIKKIIKYSLHGLLQHDCTVVRRDFDRKIPFTAAQHDWAVKLKQSR